MIVLLLQKDRGNIVKQISWVTPCWASKTITSNLSDGYVLCIHLLSPVYHLEMYAQLHRLQTFKFVLWDSEYTFFFTHKVYVCSCVHPRPLYIVYIPMLPLICLPQFKRILTIVFEPERLNMCIQMSMCIWVY